MIMRAFPLAALLALAACATSPSGSMDADLGAPSKSEAGYAVAQTAAQVADAIGQAPPPVLSRTTIDEKAIRAAYLSFDHALDLIDGAVRGGMIKRGSPMALAVKSAVRSVQAALNAASAAQRAGNASTYSGALKDARRSLAALQSNLAR